MTSTDSDPWWSKRAKARIEQVRAELAFLDPEGTTIFRGPAKWEIYTFAGLRGNRLIAHLLAGKLDRASSSDDLAIRFAHNDLELGTLRELIEDLRRQGRPDEDDALAWAADLKGLRLSKFQPCLSPRLLRLYLADQLSSRDDARAALSQPVVASV